MINDFWAEFDEFQDKLGIYENRDYIFKNHQDLLNDKVFLWHKKETLHYTKIFGAFACRVCSKILGIGSAERSWGDVKHLKVNKRSHLSGERVKKQATIFGTSCIELARYQQSQSLKDVSTVPLRIWTDEDFITEPEAVKENKKPKRIFKAYMEDWEHAAIMKRDLVNETKLLKKYGGLSWTDPDHNDVLLYADKKSLNWSRVTYHGKNSINPGTYKDGGFSVRAIGPNYDERDPENEKKNVEPWSICETIIGEIAHYYRIHTNEGVLVQDKEPDTESTNLNDKNSDDDDTKSDGSVTATE